ncbi:(p)ppGpp synthase/HD superfamily hydrolase [Parabacteroides sp. PFB2-12]|uniref:phosphohydrolase n=1 Tax=unclassified Parabacteroides TaxID=2649774 RepID=UPI0024763E73|nr:MULTISPECIES: phosphohydrolase [unclassified Parabacteroides]MDH6343744.1 (p)ppGpp synthase/HD superfamily hydrolase [Parabacteroides sp. PM6-13]MDH6391906.1 (p)ppGpp synthase/HD superfamily hydrolase [Parabacteroides sp. PFB2-12]
MLQKAIQIAIKAHESQFDKYDIPYVGHIMRVMEAGKTDDEKIVGVLHDIVEDTDWTFEKLEEEGFATYIIDAIRCLTKTSEDEPYEEFIKRVQTNPLAVRVKINDLADNMDIRRLSAISEKDVERLRKYHKAYKRLTL